MKRMIPVQKIIDDYNSKMITKEQADERFHKLDKECPRCESRNIKLYYMNGDCISMDFSNNIDELECRCEDCLYDDELFCFL